MQGLGDVREKLEGVGELIIFGTLQRVKIRKVAKMIIDSQTNGHYIDISAIAIMKNDMEVRKDLFISL